MADDIVVRLRNWDDGRVFTHYEGCWDSHPVCAILLAADAIEAQQAEIERLRAAGDELVASLTPVSFAGPHEAMNRLERAYLAWGEARRG